MNLLLTHKLSQEEAVRRVKTLSDRLYQENKKNINSLDQRWNGNKANVTLIVKGLAFKAHIAITSHDVFARLHLPLAAVLFKHKIKEEITKQLKTILC